MCPTGHGSRTHPSFEIPHGRSSGRDTKGRFLSLLENQHSAHDTRSTRIHLKCLTFYTRIQSRLTFTHLSPCLSHWPIGPGKPTMRVRATSHSFNIPCPATVKPDSGTPRSSPPPGHTWVQIAGFVCKIPKLFEYIKWFAKVRTFLSATLPRVDASLAQYGIPLSFDIALCQLPAAFS